VRFFLCALKTANVHKPSNLYLMWVASEMTKPSRINYDLFSPTDLPDCNLCLDLELDRTMLDTLFIVLFLWLCFCLDLEDISFRYSCTANSGIAGILKLYTTAEYLTMKAYKVHQLTSHPRIDSSLSL